MSSLQKPAMGRGAYLCITNTPLLYNFDFRYDLPKMFPIQARFVQSAPGSFESTSLHRTHATMTHHFMRNSSCVSVGTRLKVTVKVMGMAVVGGCGLKMWIVDVDFDAASIFGMFKGDFKHILYCIVEAAVCNGRRLSSIERGTSVY